MDILSFSLGVLAGLIVGAAVAAWLAWTLARARSAADVARAEAERDALGRRAEDLATVALEDQQTARLLSPLRDTLGRVETQVRALERERAEQLGLVTGQLEQVGRGTAELTRQTAALVGSLRASQTRGMWGEVQLRRVLELSGMMARCDFDEQVRGTSGAGAQVRPDVVVHLPGDKHLVVDAKAPAAAFLAAQEEDLPEDEARAHLGAHARALRGHVTALADKEYWSALPRTCEMVVCFVPSDAMLAAALGHDPALHDDALRNNVVLVGPGGLFALLRSVAYTWRQDALTDSAEELLRLGRELHGRIGTLAKHASAMGRSLESSVKSYNQFLGSLESRVLVTARRIEELGLAGDPVASPTPLESVPRPSTLPEEELPIELPRRPEGSTNAAS